MWLVENPIAGIIVADAIRRLDMDLTFTVDTDILPDQGKHDYNHSQNMYKTAVLIDN